MSMDVEWRPLKNLGASNSYIYRMAPLFCSVHSFIAGFHKGLKSLSMLRIHRNADTAANTYRFTIQLDPFANCLGDTRCKGAIITLGFQTENDNKELVATNSCDRIRRAHNS